MGGARPPDQNETFPGNLSPPIAVLQGPADGALFKLIPPLPARKKLLLYLAIQVNSLHLGFKMNAPGASSIWQSS